jgi:hypothetical protein
MQGQSRAATGGRWKAGETGIYRLRGQNKLDARKAGRPTEYDRLTLLYVSVFCLSHWRNDVTVKYYMI